MLLFRYAVFISWRSGDDVPFLSSKYRSSPGTRLDVSEPLFFGTAEIEGHSVHTTIRGESEQYIRLPDDVILRGQWSLTTSHGPTIEGKTTEDGP